jgi:MFS family permease
MSHRETLESLSGLLLVMAVATVAGPLLGGLIVDISWLGWRWCFFIAVPIAVVAFVVLQKTLHVPTVKRPVKMPLRDIGAASGALTFFRSLGGTIGVSVLGAVLAHRVTANLTADLAAAGLPAPRPGEGATALNLAALPDAVRTIVQSAYGDATGHILISVAVGLVGVAAALLLPRMTLRGTLDLEEGAPQPSA